MSADIVKEAVFDDRIVQSKPRYAVEKGSLSLTNAPFNAIASSQSQMTFNVYVPSENVFVDRAVRWSAEARLQMNVDSTNSGDLTNWAVALDSTTGTTGAVGALKLDSTGALLCKPIVSPGTDFSSAPFPLNYACQTMTATINDTTSVINSQDVLLEVMRLTDYKCNLLQRTCPTMLDKYQANYLAIPTNGGAINNPMSGYSEAMNVDEVGNGAWPGLYFTDSTGKRLQGNGVFPTTATTLSGITTTTAQVYYVNGVPVISGTSGVGASPYKSYLLYFSIFSTEKLTLSPFVFADDQEWDTGLFGINNIQLIMNFKSGVALSRIVKTLGDLGTNSVISGIQFIQNGTQVWNNPVVNVQFLTPSLDVPLPPKSVVPYMEFPRFITQSQNGQLDNGFPAYGQTGPVSGQALAQLQSQTITLPQIPDLLIIYIKPTQVTGYPDPQDPSYGDAYIPIASSVLGGIKNPLSINFDNFSGLLSSHTNEELYAMSVKNGLSMTYGQWSGVSRTTIPVNASVSTAALANSTAGAKSAYPPIPAGGWIATTGGPLVLKPSQDITLQSGQAPSLVGNFTLQFNLQVYNTYPFPVQPNLYVITANSGFFESIRGSSRIIKGVLSEQDIISAPVSSAQTREGLKRLVGGKVSFGSMANVFSRAKEHYNATKPHMGHHTGMGASDAGAMPMEGSGRRGASGISRRLM